MYSMTRATTKQLRSDIRELLFEEPSGRRFKRRELATAYFALTATKPLGDTPSVRKKLLKEIDIEREDGQYHLPLRQTELLMLVMELREAATDV